MSTLDPRPAGNVPSDAPSDPRNDAEMCQNVPECSGMSHEKKSRVENEPTADRPPRPLAPRQLIAARLLARGFGSVDVARHLGVDHHTIARWKRQPVFIAAIERFQHDLTSLTTPSRPLEPLAAYVQNTATPHAGAERSAAPASFRAAVDDDDDDDDDLDEDEEEISDEEFAETEAWIEQIIAAKRTGKEIPPPRPPKETL